MSLDSPESVVAPSVEEVRHEMHRILAIPEFIASERLTQFLEFVVTESLAGRASRIKAYTIGVEAFGRKPSFSSRTDPIVGVTAQRLRQALERYYVRNPQAQVRIEIPLGAYRPAFRWIVRSSQPREDQPLDSSLAVLPLADLGHRDRDAFADGLAEELSNALCRFDDIRVVPHISALHLIKSGNHDVEQLGKELRVSFLLTGSVHRSDRRVRIRVALVRVRDRAQVWSEMFSDSFETDSLFKVQDRIVDGVAKSIAGECGVMFRAVYADEQSRAGCENSTYEAVMRSYQYEQTLSPETFRTARVALERALQVSPNYALAWAHYGILCLDAAAFGYGEIEDPISRGSDAIRRALELHPRCQFAHYGRAFAGLLKKDQAGVIESANRIVELNPNNVFLVGTAGFFLALAGEFERGLAILRVAMNETPHYPSWWRFATFLDALRRRAFEEAWHEAVQFDMPDFFWGPLLRATANGYRDQPREADDCYAQVFRMLPDFAHRPRHYVGQFVLDEAVANMILEPAYRQPQVAGASRR